jgi:hypothetical protein
MQMHSFVKAALVGLTIAGLANAQVIVNSDITTSTTWTSNNVYQMTTQIYVRNGATLTIQPGTRIASVLGGSLAVTRGSQIQALGTELAPIVFTSTSDTGVWREAALEWGNLTVMGRAYISEAVATIPTNVPTFSANNYGIMEGLIPMNGTDPNVRYGGGNDDDDSGTISYCSFRYGGTVIGLNDELNGLSLGGIGRGTDIHHIEIMNNVDDGIEIWGGTVNFKYVSIWNIGDDSFDIDQGWRGKAQFGLIVQGYSLNAAQGSGVGDNCLETDGAEDSDQQPVTTAAIYNFTVIGQPSQLDQFGGVLTEGGDGATAWRDNARIQYHNCIFMDCGEKVVRFDNSDGDGANGYGYHGTLSWAATWTTPNNAVPPHANDPVNPSLYYMAQPAGFLAEIVDSVFYNNTAPDAYPEAIARGVTAVASNVIEPLNSPIQSITRLPAVIRGGKYQQRVSLLDPRPANDALTSVGWATGDSFLCAAHYRGAFAPGCNWLARWSAADEFGMLVTDGWVDVGKGLEGLNGYPVLAGAGTFAPGSNISLTLSNEAINVWVLGLGIQRIDFPLLGGTLVVNPSETFFALGFNQFNFTTPGGLSGYDFYWQGGVFDSAAVQGIAFTNALVKRAL